MARPRLGHAHLLVRDVDRSVAFYAEVFGLDVVEHEQGRWAFLSSGEAHHELALSQLGMEAPGPDEHRVGLLHLEFDVPDKRSFAEVVRRLLHRGVELRPVDHRIAWGVYFADPDGNGLEIGCDTRHEPDGADYWEGTNRPLDLDRVLGLLERPQDAVNGREA